MKDFLERHGNYNNYKDQAVLELYVRLAGDKLEEVNKAAHSFMSKGKTFNRALADALEQFNLA